jgi:hypothetical protein
VGVKRIKPNILSERFDESRTFYNDVIGLDGGDGLDWILFFGTDQREVQLSVMKLDIKARVHPDVSIEVDDVASPGCSSRGWCSVLAPKSRAPSPCRAWWTSARRCAS